MLSFSVNVALEENEFDESTQEKVLSRFSFLSIFGRKIRKNSHFELPRTDFQSFRKISLWRKVFRWKMTIQETTPASSWKRTTSALLVRRKSIQTSKFIEKKFRSSFGRWCWWKSAFGFESIGFLSGHSQSFREKRWESSIRIASTSWNNSLVDKTSRSESRSRFFSIEQENFFGRSNFFFEQAAAHSVVWRWIDMKKLWRRWTLATAVLFFIETKKFFNDRVAQTIRSPAGRVNFFLSMIRTACRIFERKSSSKNWELSDLFLFFFLLRDLLDQSSFERIRVEKNDLIILSSDGLWDVINNEDLRLIIERNKNKVNSIAFLFLLFGKQKKRKRIESVLFFISSNQSLKSLADSLLRHAIEGNLHSTCSSISIFPKIFSRSKLKGYFVDSRDDILIIVCQVVEIWIKIIFYNCRR